MTFKEKFKAERARQGAGKTFTWNGKLYTTDMASDKKQTKPKAKPKAKTMQSSPVPKRSPRETPPKVDSTPPKTLTSPKATPPVTTKDVTTTSLDKSKGGRGSGAAEVKQRKTDSFVNTMKAAIDKSETKPKVTGDTKPQTNATAPSKKSSTFGDKIRSVLTKGYLSGSAADERAKKRAQRYKDVDQAQVDMRMQRAEDEEKRVAKKGKK